MITMVTSICWSPAHAVTRLYRNDGGSFTRITTSIPDVVNSAAAWGDYDNDGDLDILITGADSGWNPMARVYRNDSATFTTYIDIDPALRGIQDGSVAWGDYDNDGDLDILLAGRASDPITRIYRNNGNETFTDIGAGLPGGYGPAAAWGDYDNDGDLDILLTGDFTSEIYRNDGGSFTPIRFGDTRRLGGLGGLRQ